MKLFALLSIVVAAEAALSSIQQNAARTVFNSLDQNHNGDLNAGGVYTALSKLDTKLTEQQLQNASKGRKKINFKQFLDIYSKLEGGQSNSKYPKGCKNWFDGCNHCIIKNGKEVGCTEMFCPTRSDAKYCTVYEDGRQCKSATNCQMKQQHYNCFTKEVWTAAKKAYCCKTKKMGCPANTNTQTGLKAGAVCYAFYENGRAGVNRKNDCPKGYKCASDPNVMSFNTVMHCVKESTSKSSGIPKGCTSWYDGCNTCSVQDGKKSMCTKMACFRQGKAYCKSYGVAKLDNTPINLAN